MSHPLNLIPTPDTPLKRVASFIQPGRPGQKIPGGWISDNVSLRKLITLCPLHVHKFNPRKYGYVKFHNYILGPYVDASCMDCKTRDPRCTSYVAEEFDHLVSFRRPARGRWATIAER